MTRRFKPRPLPAEPLPPPPEPMTKERLREIMHGLRIDRDLLAWMLGCNVTNIHRWARGQTAVPPKVDYWLERLWTYFEAAPPPPTDWRRNRQPRRNDGETASAPSHGGIE